MCSCSTESSQLRAVIFFSLLTKAWLYNLKKEIQKFVSLTQQFDSQANKCTHGHNFSHVRTVLTCQHPEPQYCISTTGTQRNFTCLVVTLWDRRIAVLPKYNESTWLNGTRKLQWAPIRLHPPRLTCHLPRLKCHYILRILQSHHIHPHQGQIQDLFRIFSFRKKARSPCIK